jgi:hypothetical protein
MEKPESRHLRLTSIYESFKQLFNRAKAKDEFEYCCALWLGRGMQTVGWDTLQESHALLQQILSFVDGPIDSGFRTRLLLLAYCHTIEMNFIYNMIANMIHISLGKRYCADWFDKDSQQAKKAPVSPGKKIEAIQKWIKDTEWQEMGEILSEMYLRDVRNAFAHADYVLFEDCVRIRDGNQAKEYKLEFLLPKMELGINLAFILVQLTREGILSYKENKRISSRMEVNPLFEVELLVDPDYGLQGFHSVLKQKQP